MSERDQEIIEIQSQWLSDYGEHKRWIIVEVLNGYELHIHSYDSVHPVITYGSKRDVAARLLQLLEIGPVAPQNHPEIVEISVVDAS